MKTWVSTILLIMCMLMPMQGWGQQNDSISNDSIDRNAPDFVKVSLVVATPGDVLYSCVGHAILRLECPTYNLDYVFSYESEDVKHKVLSFLAGQLHMGMFCVKSEDYFKQYAIEGRGLKQYTLNLPIEMKRNLWEKLDNRVAEGCNLPYDYLARGCAQSVLNVLEAAAYPNQIEFGPWPEKYGQTRREFVDSNVSKFPWNRFILYTVVGTEADNDVMPEEKVVIPADLVEILQNAKIKGKTIITDEPKVILDAKPLEKATFFTPMFFAIVILVLAVLSFIRRKDKWTRYIDWTILGLQIIIGLFMTYLIFISSLPVTNWSWLVIPFNPLPIIFWKWRKKWGIWAATIMLLWCIGMIAYPHKLTDPTYIVLVLGFAIMYTKEGYNRHAKKIGK